MRYRTLLEQPIDDWDDGRGVVQIVNPEESDENELRFAYYTGGEYVNRPLTVAPDAEVAERVADVVPTMASLARTFTPDEIEALVAELGPDRVRELAVLVDELGRSRLLEILEDR
ncbi:MAG: hypothetical protein ABEJ31_11800 [Haloarculaceae archaeon]